MYSVFKLRKNLLSTTKLSRLPPVTVVHGCYLVALFTVSESVSMVAKTFIAILYWQCAWYKKRVFNVCFLTYPDLSNLGGEGCWYSYTIPYDCHCRVFLLKYTMVN
jgi:hypothetical protein